MIALVFIVCSCGKKGVTVVSTYSETKVISEGDMQNIQRIIEAGKTGGVARMEIILDKNLAESAKAKIGLIGGADISVGEASAGGAWNGKFAIKVEYNSQTNHP